MAKQGVRLTKNRDVLLEVLHVASGPLSPPMIVKRCHLAGRMVNKTTVYRELDTLMRVGIVQRVMVSDRKQYFELSERGHHHHFVCRLCDAVQDVAIVDDLLVHQARQLGRQLSFVIEEHAVEFYGRCAACMNHSHSY